MKFSLFICSANRNSKLGGTYILYSQNYVLVFAL